MWPGRAADGILANQQGQHMPKRRLNIQTFAGLASPALDDEDVPLEGASFASGLDPTERPGRLRGFPEDEATGLGHPVKAQAMLDGGDTVVFWDGGNVRQMTGAESGIDGSSSLVDGGGAFSTPDQVQMTSDGERIYMARGDALPAKWIGEFRRQHVHDTSLPSGLQIEGADLKKPEGHQLNLTGLRGSTDTGGIEDGVSYRFAISWTYDGFQESPLRVLDQSFTGSGDEYADLRLKWTQLGETQTPKRVTHVNLYVIEGAASGENPIETGQPRLIRTETVDSSNWLVAGDSLVDIQSNPNWTPLYDYLNLWSLTANSYVYGGKQRGNDPKDQKNTVSINDITADDLSLLDVNFTAEVKVPDSGGTGTSQVTAYVKDGSGTTLDSQSTSLSSSDLGSGDELPPEDEFDLGRVSSFTLSLSTFTAANAESIEIVVKADVGGDFAYAKTIVDSVRAEFQSTSGATYAVDFSWQGGGGAPYEQRTGLAPTADQPQINYTVSAEHSGFHFVSGASVDGEDYGSYIFRSKAGRFSQFAWAQDYLNLDTKIHSLTSFNGRLWAFSQSAVYRIDANTLTVEREYKGKGALGHRSITRSPLGLFWVNEENLFLHDGRELRDVGGPIKAGDFQEVWANLSTSEAPMTWYDPQNNVLVVAFRCIQQNLIPANEMWMLHFPEERWTDAIPGPRWMHLIPPEAWSANSNLQESFLGADGVPYFSVGDDLYSFATASVKRPWEWVSKEITGGQPGIEKVFYHADIKGDTPTSVYYKEDEGTWQTASLEATNENRSRWPVNSGAAAPPWKGVYHFRLKIEGAGDDEVSSVSFLIRPRSRTR